MKIKVFLICCAVFTLLTACRKITDFPTGSQDVAITQEQKNVKVTLKTISYIRDMPNRENSTMNLRFDVSNNTAETLIFYGSINPKKTDDNILIMIGNEQYTTNGLAGRGPEDRVNFIPRNSDGEFGYQLFDGVLTGYLEFSVIFDASSPPDFKKPIKCKVPAKMGNEKIDFTFDLPLPPTNKY